MSVQPSRSADQRRADRRARLIDAAADVYGDVGYRSATVRMICRRARLTERYFYESFESSEHLLVEAAVALAGRMHAHLIAVRDARPTEPAENLSRVLHAYFRALSLEASQARVFTLEIRGIGSAADAALERILDAFADLIVAIADPAGVGRAARDRLLRRGIVGGVLQIAIAWIAGDFSESLDDVAGSAEHVCGLALAAPRAARSAKKDS